MHRKVNEQRSSPFRTRHNESTSRHRQIEDSDMSLSYLPSVLLQVSQ